jgi:hypothetical protein
MRCCATVYIRYTYRRCKLCNHYIVDIERDVDPMRMDKYIICPCCFQVQSWSNTMSSLWIKKVDRYIKDG